jgi:hypothetical protein
VLQQYVDEARALTDQIIDITWYMRGGMGREEAWHLSHKERIKVLKLIEGNIERTNKTGLVLL